MNGFGDSEDSAQRQLVLDAAVAELATKKVDAFTLEGVAARAGLDARQVRSMWPNTPDLYSATIMEFAKRYITIPDTGTRRHTRPRSIPRPGGG